MGFLHINELLANRNRRYEREKEREREWEREVDQFDPIQSVSGRKSQIEKRHIQVPFDTGSSLYLSTLRNALDITQKYYGTILRKAERDVIIYYLKKTACGLPNLFALCRNV
ncbi:hypothetical protein PUN28_002803 [Cardiocondyla obscurior]|uniref:Uncharacterized protein n=1 Tax=Cardiocondyla obscurior TaxID=286306 RepID=A0AAW2GWB2_9HYME